MSLIETNDSQRKQCLGNTAGGVGLCDIVMLHCHAAKSLYRVFHRIAAVCLSKLGLNALIAFDTYCLCLFQTVLAAHNILRLAGPTKYGV